jgi:hypothetical protein
MKRPLIVASCLLGAVLIAGLAALIKPQDPACVRFQAKIDLAEAFCDGLSQRAAQERCSALSDSPEVMGQCMRVIVPAAFSGCMDYVNLQSLKQEHKSLCQ